MLSFKKTTPSLESSTVPLEVFVNVALTPPLVIEKQGDIKKSYQIYVIGVYVEEVIKREVFNA